MPAIGRDACYRLAVVMDIDKEGQQMEDRAN